MYRCIVLCKTIFLRIVFSLVGWVSMGVNSLGGSSILYIIGKIVDNILQNKKYESFLKIIALTY